MKKGSCEIVCVLDRSGSMTAIREEAVGAFNRFLEEQRKVPGECRITVVQFDDVYEVLYTAIPIAEAPGLIDGVTYVPRGTTALLDAVGRTIAGTGARFAAMAEADRPEKVICVVVTDGAENASKEFARSQVTAQIQLQRDVYKWEFVFLSAGPEAFAEAQALGVAASNVVQYAAGDANAQSVAMARLGRGIAAARRTAAPANWNEA